MLVDAGALADGLPLSETDPRPNASHRAGEWISRYIEHMMAPAPARLDYAVLTHFHYDHMGQVTSASPMSLNGSYKLSGITDVGDKIPIGTLIDRGYPSYDFPDPQPASETFKNYRSFVAEQVKKGMKIERIEVGRNDQITLKRDAARYPAFEVRNVSANGDVWTGTGTAVTHVFPADFSKLIPEDRPTENMSSIGLRIRYGKFDYWTGGDIPGIPDPGSPEWHSIETPIAKAIGPTDVHVVNHHGSISPESGIWLSTLKSRVIIFPVWSPTHPSQDSLKRALTMRLYPGPRDIFVTLLRPTTAASIGDRVKQLKSTHGHVVIRVAPGGGSYQIFILDDTSESYQVIGTFGPYEAE